MTISLELRRKWLTEASTIGELWIDGVFECFTLEDRYRLPWEQKVPGATCIPCGVYPVAITPSPRFHRDLPLVMNVHGFSGIRIHPGNVAADTEGCVLVGRVRHHESVQESRLAFDALFEKLKLGSGIVLAVTIN